MFGLTCCQEYFLVSAVFHHSQGIVSCLCCLFLGMEILPMKTLPRAEHHRTTDRNKKKINEKQEQWNKQHFLLKCISAYHITFLSENVLCHCFKAHPFHWQFSSITSHGILVFIIQFSCQTKVCNFHHQIVIQPEDNQRVQNTLTKDFVVDQNGIILTTYMQFLAAKSLWTIFISVRYAIPFAVPSPNPSNRFVSIA